MAVPDRSQVVEIPYFAGLPPAELDHVTRCLHERRYRKGAVLFGEGEPGDAVFFVKSGRIKVFRLTADGREEILRIWEAGAPIGLVVVMDAAPYPASAESMEDSVVWMMRTQDFVRLLDVCPTLAAKTLRAAGSLMRRAHDRAHHLAMRGVHGRLAALLLEHYERQGARLELGLTHHELGALLGASRETVSRALADFRRERAIRVEHDAVVVLDAAKLAGWL